jgi:vacuolar-type H+-ATPase subunit H
MSASHVPSASLDSLPQLEQLPRVGDGGYDADSVAAAFDAFWRNAMQLRAELRVVKAAAGRAPSPAPATNHEARMSAMRIIRAAAEFADAIELEAQKTSAAQLERLDANLERRQREVVENEQRIVEMQERVLRDRDRLIREAEVSARGIVAGAHRDADGVIAEARRKADHLSVGMQADVEETLGWARAQAASILARVQQVSREILGAASGVEQVDDVLEAVVEAGHAATVESHGPPPSLVAPLYESLETARQNATRRNDPPLGNSDQPIR